MAETKSYYILKAIRCGGEWAQEIMEEFIRNKTIPDDGDEATYLLAAMLCNIKHNLYDLCSESYDEFCSDLNAIHAIHFTMHVCEPEK